MNKSTATLLFLLLVFNLCSAFKILVVFPYPGRSHTILGEGYVRLLLKAGHEVTYITPILSEISHPKLRQIDVSSNMKTVPLGIFLNFKKFMSREVNANEITGIYRFTFKVANTSIMHQNVQKLIHDPEEEFDVVIGQWLYSELYSGFATVFNCPYIYSSSLEPHAMVLRLIDEQPNPAYTPDYMLPIEPPLNFIQRIKELWNLIYLSYGRYTVAANEIKAFKLAFGHAVEKRGRTLPTFDEVKFNASMILGNSHVSTGLAMTLPQNYISIAGYHISDELAPLPNNLKEILDNAPYGVIYFSMGTLMKSNTMPEELKRDFLKVFSTLKQTVIWKFEENLQNLPKNVHIVQWAPQPSILAHGKCILFITHGGLLSTIEALHFGVPIIGIPLFADQFINVKRAVTKGFARQVDLGYDSPAKLKIAIDDVLENPKYRERVKDLSFIYHNRRVSPGAELVHWVEHVVKTRGALHLRSPALHVPWYQKMYLDLLAIIIIILVVFIQLVRTMKMYITRIKYLRKPVIQKSYMKKNKKRN